MMRCFLELKTKKTAFMEENFSGMMGSQFQLGSRIVIPTVSLLFIALSNTEVFLDCCAVKHIKAYFAFSVDANKI